MTELNVQEYLSVLKDPSKIEFNLIDSYYINLFFSFDDTDLTIQTLYSSLTNYMYIRDWRTCPYPTVSIFNFSKLCKEDYHFQQMTKYDIPFSYEEVQQIMDVITCLLSQTTTKVKTA